MSCRSRRAAAALFAAALLGPVGAAERAPPIEIEADTVDVDARAGVSVYEGDARMTRGAMRITGDRMEVHTHDDGELSHILVDGTPATYRDHPEGQPAPIEAEARHMAYFARDPERARFEGDARLWQRDDEVTAHTIEVNLETRTMQAEGREGERARTILYPGRRDEP